MKTLIAACCLLLAAAAQAQTPSPDKLHDLEQKIDALSHEVEQLKLGGAPAGKPAWLDKLSLGGYAEGNALFYSRRNQRGAAGSPRNTTDIERFVLMLEYRFSERILFKSEFEVEHAGTGEGSETRGEAELEQAYVDFIGWEPLNARAGHILMPVGLLNETHEPPTYHGVLRPRVETVVIPTTWHENGVGLFGGYGPLSYRSYVTAGLNAVKGGGPSVDGFTGSNGIRGGRSEGSQSPTADLAWVGRLDVKPVPGALLGSSLYLGGAAQNAALASVPVTLWEFHGAFDWRGAELRALYAQSTVGNADAVNRSQLIQDANFTDNAGRRQFGGYVQAAFDLLSLRGSTQYLAPFFRYERYDTQSRVPNGYLNNAANSRVDYTLGLTFKPVAKVALKADYQWRQNQTRTGVDQFNLGLGVMF